MKKKIYTILIFLISFIIIIFLWSVNIYNELNLLNENVKSQWSKVDSSYQRRLDLIPNLVNTVKGASKFENETLINVIRARSNATSINIDTRNLNQKEISKYQYKYDKLNNSLSRLLLTVEKYPDIKSINNFTELQSQLEGTENRINFERNKFNETVQNFNQYRNKFPAFIISNLLNNFLEKGYFQSQNNAKNAPIVKFNDN